MSDTFWTISELAQEFSITPRTIRFYEDQGIVSPRREGRNRVYSARDRTRLKLALRGKRAAPSTARSVADGLRRVRMPLLVALEHINRCLHRDKIDGRKGWTIVD